MNSRAKGVLGRVVSGIVLGGLAVSAWATPFCQLSIVGRRAGTTDTFTPSLTVTAGESVEYEIRLKALTSVGATYSNSSITVASGKINANDGVAGMASFNLLQVASNGGVQFSFDGTTMGTTNSSYPDGTGGGTILNQFDDLSAGAHGGLKVVRGTTGYYDLRGITLSRPTGAIPAFVLPQTDLPVLTGTFTIAVATSGSAQLSGDMLGKNPTGGTGIVTSTLKIKNGSTPYTPSLTVSDGTLVVSTGGRTLPPGNDPAFLWNALTLNAAVISSTTYTLAATASATKIHAGGSSTITATITNTGSADTLDYTNLTLTNATALTGTWPKAANTAPIAIGGGADTSSGSVAGGVSGGTYTFTPSVASATNHSTGTIATLATTTPATVEVYNLASAPATQRVNVGLIHMGDSKTVAVSLSNTAPADATYTETLGSNGFSGTSAGFTASGAVSGILGGNSGSGTLTVGLGPTLSAGHQSGITTLALNSSEVHGSGLGVTATAPQTLTITGDVFAGSATWTSTGNTSWGSMASANWTDPNGVQAAPGTFSGFSNTDSATFDGGTAAINTVNLDSAAPSLKSLSFIGPASYSIAQGSASNKLTLASNTSSATITVIGSHAITAPVTLSSNTTINVTSPADALAISGNIDGGGMLTNTGAGTLTLSGDNRYTGGTTIQTGTIRTTSLTALGTTATASATVQTNGTLHVDVPGINLASLTVNGTVTTTSLAAGGVGSTGNIELGTVDGSGNTVVPGTLTLGPTGLIDLQDRMLIVHYTQSSTTPSILDGPATSIKAALVQGRNVAAGGVFDGPWNGTAGITSSRAASDFSAAHIATGSPNTEFYALGYGDTGKMILGDGTITNKMLINDAGPNFYDPAANGGRGAGIGTTVFVRYTRVGDATMDGIVGNNDVTVLGLNFDPTYDPATNPNGPKQWYDGDFNYNGVVDNNDVTILGLQFDPTNTSAVLYSSLVSQYGASFASSFAQGYAMSHPTASLVPEPGALTLLGVGALALIRRRRRA